MQLFEHLVTDRQAVHDGSLDLSELDRRHLSVSSAHTIEGGLRAPEESGAESQS